MSRVTVKVLRLPHAQGLELPSITSAMAAGCDLAAAVDDPVEIAAGARAVIPTGFAFAIPPGYEGQVRPRSGLAAKHGVTVLNAPGTIDADYRGEVKAILINHSQTAFTVTRGLRMAQMVIAPVIAVDMVEADSLDETTRGTGGFGSSGMTQ
jgi:dUTP pyrophosphatase